LRLALAVEEDRYGRVPTVATAGYELHLHVRKIVIVEFQRKWG